MQALGKKILKKKITVYLQVTCQSLNVLISNIYWCIKVTQSDTTLSWGLKGGIISHRRCFSGVVVNIIPPFAQYSLGIISMLCR